MTRPEPALAEGRRRGTRPLVLTLLLLAVVLTAARTGTGAAVVMGAQRFLEFYSGVFALLALTGAVVSGVGAAQRLVPIRFRILAQAMHRAMAVLAVGFLVAHVLLKIMEAHATVLDTVVPFAGGRGRVLYVGLGTIAADLLILVLATGVIRGRFVARSRPWIWRTVHATAYVMWPLAMIHGLSAGRPPKAWVTWSYVLCFAVVMVATVSRLPRLVRDRRMLRTRAPGSHARTPDGGSQTDVPDERFWASLRAEAANWSGGRR
ncbi:MAG TPA: hypothetical protein VGD53_03105 [Actinoallomurus sp.]|jgi:DMSO/TMAO reductase YedYZ heme-binding membrane subunit